MLTESEGDRAEMLHVYMRDAALHHFNLKQTTLVPAIWSGVIPHLEIC